MSDITPPWLDPVAAWRRLPAETQEQIGAAAITMVIGTLGMDDEAPAYAAAQVEGMSLLEHHVVQHVLGTALPWPRLTPLGIRQCRGCGCTDRVACPDGCSWVGRDLCSTCATDAR